MISASTSAELVGTVLEGRYRVDRALARGGMSSVFRGMDLRLDRPVAIKVMEPRFVGDRSFIERFELEARAAARLHHPNVVAVHDQGVDGDHVFLVMELVAGGTLRDLLRERRVLPANLALSVLEPVLAALGAAHRAGLVHRDVKPENVLIGADGAVKVADFGLVRALARAGTTSAKVILGTMAYLSPEQVSTGAADARSDVYSAGVLLYEMLTGVPPYQADTPLSVAYRHVNDDVPPPSDRQPGIDPALDELVQRATRRDPAQRPADAAAFLAEARRTRIILGLNPMPVPVPEIGHVSEGEEPDDERTQRTDPMSGPAAGASAVSAETALASVAGQLDPERTVRTTPAAAPGGVGPQGTRAWNRDELGMPPGGPAGPPPLGPPRAGPPGRPPGPPPPPSYADQRRRNRKLFIIWTCVVLALALVIGVAAWWFGSGRWTAVPRVTGLDANSAEQVLKDSDLAATVNYVHDNTIKPGQAVGTTPAVGNRVLRGSTVTLLMSEGRPVVPDVVAGSQVAAAQQAITAQGLTPKVDPNQDAYDDTVPIGAVSKLMPPPGTPLPLGGTVTIVRSKGPAPKPVPNVVGTPQAQATATLAQAGFQVSSVTQQFSGSVPGGTVLSTNPPAGTVVAAGGNHQVTLVVSNAVTVPDVTGQAVTDAQNALTALGLQVSVQQFGNFGQARVIQQSIPPGTLVQAGTAITLAAFP